ncbi:MAG: PmoA family protein [Planctomycetes bacterium]|nr:PmoA family protein [Planctomycetota bacterium]
MLLQTFSRLPLTLFACLTLAGTLAAGTKGEFRWENREAEGQADLFYGELPVLRYMYAYDDSTPERREETYKPFHHVFGPGTDQLISKGPGGHYTHHRGLYVGWNKTTAGDGKTYDFWHCRDGVHQRHVKFLEMEGGRDGGTMTALIHWNDPEGQPVVTETRTVRVSLPESIDRTAWQIDWQTKLESNRGEITLDGDRQHSGFQFRAANAVAEANSARYIRPQEFAQEAEAVQVNDRIEPDKHVDLGWLAMTYELDGKRYTVEYFENPALPSPSRYSERPYGRFGAFFVAKLSPKKPPLVMRYRVVVSTGEAPARDAIQARYEKFVSEIGADDGQTAAPGK